MNLLTIFVILSHEATIPPVHEAVTDHGHARVVLRLIMFEAPLPQFRCRCLTLPGDGCRGISFAVVKTNVLALPLSLPPNSTTGPLTLAHAQVLGHRGRERGRVGTGKRGRMGTR